MGTYLSTPIVDQGIEEGQDLDCTTPVAWGVVDMQGWRKSMEDSHIAQTDIPPPPFANTTAHGKLFAVFDGHGGAEVARFCQLYLIDVLTHQDQWNAKTVDVGEALVRCFHALDCLVDSADRRYVLFDFI
jgi:serine/threonine protein phosphatase PrpC